MADDLIPTTTPEEGSDQKATNNGPANEEERQPEKPLSPTQPNEQGPVGLTGIDWVELLGCAGWCFILWPDFLDSHDIRRLWFYFGGLSLLHIGVCHPLSKALKSVRSAVAIWLFLSVLASAVVYENSRPSPPRKPHIMFAVTTSHALGTFLEITNAFLQADKNTLYLSPTGAVLAIATSQDEKTVTLEFNVLNDPASRVEVNDLEVEVLLPKVPHFEMDSGWQKTINVNVGAAENARTVRFVRKFPRTFFPSEGEVLPSMTVSSSPPSPTVEYGNVLPIVFIVSSKGSPLFSVGFWLLLVKMPPGDTSLVLPAMISGARGVSISNGAFFAIQSLP